MTTTHRFMASSSPSVLTTLSFQCPGDISFPVSLVSPGASFLALEVMSFASGRCSDLRVEQEAWAAPKHCLRSMQFASHSLQSMTGWESP